jgi:hypothetical protein
MMTTRFLSAMTLTVLIAPPVSADEVYEAYRQQSYERLADIIYEIDVDTYAVWLLEDGSARFYIEGLAGVYSERGEYQGYYVVYEEGEEACPEPMPDHNGMEIFQWGLLDIEWHSDSEFTLQLSRCDQPPDPALTILGKGL